MKRLLPILLLWGCSATTPADPGVLLIALDGVRADRLGSAGYLPTDTPNLDALAASGTRFERAYSVSTSAQPALATVLSGLAPPVHGHRSSSPLKALPKEGWAHGLAVSRIPQNDALWADLASFEPGHSDGSVLDVWVGGLSELGRSVSIPEYDGALRQLDESLGSVITGWREAHPDGHVVVVGLRGSLTGARFDAELGVTDDWVHVPMIMAGPNVESGWSVRVPVSTLDLGAWFAERFDVPFQAAGRNPLHGGSERAFHESTLGWERFGAEPLQGFTEDAGRYLRGSYGEWYGLQKGAIRGYPDPRSEYPVHEEELSRVIASLGPAVVLDVPRPELDPRDLVESMSLLNKASQALDRGRVMASNRILTRLEADHPDASAVKALRARVDAKAE